MGAIGTALKSARETAGWRQRLRAGYEQLERARQAYEQAQMDREQQGAMLELASVREVLEDPMKRKDLPEETVTKLQAAGLAAVERMRKAGQPDFQWTDVDPIPGAVAADLHKRQYGTEYSGIDPIFLLEDMESLWGSHFDKLQMEWIQQRGGQQPGVQPESPEIQKWRSTQQLHGPPAQVAAAPGPAMHGAAPVVATTGPGPEARPAQVGVPIEAGLGPVRLTEPTPVDGPPTGETVGPGAEAVLQGGPSIRPAAYSGQTGSAVSPERLARIEKANQIFPRLREGYMSPKQEEEWLAQQIVAHKQAAENGADADLLARQMDRMATVGAKHGLSRVDLAVMTQPNMYRQEQILNQKRDDLWRMSQDLDKRIDVRSAHYRTDTEAEAATADLRRQKHAVDVELGQVEPGEMPPDYAAIPVSTFSERARDYAVERGLGLREASIELGERRLAFEMSKPTGGAKQDPYGRDAAAIAEALTTDEKNDLGFAFGNAAKLHAPQRVRKAWRAWKLRDAGIYLDKATNAWVVPDAAQKQFDAISEEEARLHPSVGPSESGQDGGQPFVIPAGASYGPNECYKAIQDTLGGKQDLRKLPVSGSGPDAEVRAGDILYLTPEPGRKAGHWVRVMGDGEHVYEWITRDGKARLSTGRTVEQLRGRIRTVYRPDHGGDGGSTVPPTDVNRGIVSALTKAAGSYTQGDGHEVAEFVREKLRGVVAETLIEEIVKSYMDKYFWPNVRAQG